MATGLTRSGGSRRRARRVWQTLVGALVGVVALLGTGIVAYYEGSSHTRPEFPNSIPGSRTDVSYRSPRLRPPCFLRAWHHKIRIHRIAIDLRQRMIFEIADVCWQLDVVMTKCFLGKLVEIYPDDTDMRVSHETIYETLFLQARGELRTQLKLALRTGRTRRISPSRTAQARGGIVGMVNISERPKEAEDRAVPGFWEGDLVRHEAPCFRARVRDPCRCVVTAA